jgi:hypothetical protein
LLPLPPLPALTTAEHTIGSSRFGLPPGVDFTQHFTIFRPFIADKKSPKIALKFFNSN